MYQFSVLDQINKLRKYFTYRKTLFYLIVAVIGMFEIVYLFNDEPFVAGMVTVCTLGVSIFVIRRVIQGYLITRKRIKNRKKVME